MSPVRDEGRHTADPWMGRVLEQQQQVKRYGGQRISVITLRRTAVVRRPVESLGAPPARSGAAWKHGTVGLFTTELIARHGPWKTFTDIVQPPTRPHRLPEVDQSLGT